MTCRSTEITGLTETGLTIKKMTYNFQGQDFSIIPQEIVYEIFKYVPEYGHRVDRELHRLSNLVESSIYCDFYRYFARFGGCHIEDLIATYGIGIQGDIRNGIKRYFQKNLCVLLCNYLGNNRNMTRDMLKEYGLKVGNHTTQMARKYLDNGDVYQDKSYYNKVTELYAYIILYNNGLVSKQEFDEYCLGIELNIILEIITSVYHHSYEIFENVVKHFGDRLQAIRKSIQSEGLKNTGIMKRHDRCSRTANENIRYLMDAKYLAADE